MTLLLKIIRLVVDVFVEGVDLETLGFERVIAIGKGRPGYPQPFC
jgi:hypothetical protein